MEPKPKNDCILVSCGYLKLGKCTRYMIINYIQTIVLQNYACRDNSNLGFESLEDGNGGRQGAESSAATNSKNNITNHSETLQESCDLSEVGNVLKDLRVKKVTASAFASAIADC